MRYQFVKKVEKKKENNENKNTKNYDDPPNAQSPSKKKPVNDRVNLSKVNQIIFPHPL